MYIIINTFSCISILRSKLFSLEKPNFMPFSKYYIIFSHLHNFKYNIFVLTLSTPNPATTGAKRTYLPRKKIKAIKLQVNTTISDTESQSEHSTSRPKRFFRDGFQL